MGNKLPAWTLEQINRSELRSIVLSWTKENFRA